MLGDLFVIRVACELIEVIRDFAAATKIQNSKAYLHFGDNASMCKQ